MTSCDALNRIARSEDRLIRSARTEESGEQIDHGVRSRERGDTVIWRGLGREEWCEVEGLERRNRRLRHGVMVDHRSRGC